MAQYAQLDSNDQLTGKTKNIEGTPPTKAELAPGKPYWLPVVRIDVDNSTGPNFIDEVVGPVVDLPGQRVTITTTRRDMTTQEIDNDADAEYDRFVVNNREMAALALVMADLVEQAFGVSQTVARQQVKSRWIDYFKSLA